jgi:hypothetical protein
MFVLSLLTAPYLVGTNVVSELGHLWRVGAACSLMALFVLILRHELAGTHLNAVFELGITAAFGAAVYIGALFILGIRLKAISMQVT